MRGKSPQPFFKNAPAGQPHETAAYAIRCVFRCLSVPIIINGTPARLLKSSAVCLRLGNWCVYVSVLDPHMCEPSLRLFIWWMHAKSRHMHRASIYFNGLPYALQSSSYILLLLVRFITMLQSVSFFFFCFFFCHVRGANINERCYKCDRGFHKCAILRAFMIC